MKESEMFRANKILEANKKKIEEAKKKGTVVNETDEKIEELSHSITFYFKKDKREFRLEIKIDRDNEGKIEIDEMNDDEPILIASTNTNWILYEKLIDQSRGVLFDICQLADELANEYIK